MEQAYDFYLNRKLKDIAESIRPLPHCVSVRDAFLFLMKEHKISLVPIVDEKYRVLGQIQRKRFIEEVVLSRFGYGIHLNGSKKLMEVAEKPEFLFQTDLSIEEAALQVQDRSDKFFYDDIIVVNQNKYFGVVPVRKILEALTYRAIKLARDENPLTCLPGNWAIKRYIEERISKGEKFEVIYVDLDNFKPYNDNYGFAKGDEVIVSLGEILKKISRKHQCFVGHIGGDDFVVVCKPEFSYEIAREIVAEFEKLLPLFHGKDYQMGFYISRNRKGEVQTFPLLSLSLAITGNSQRKIESYPQLVSIATEVKSMAKQMAKTTGKSAIFKDRRKDQNATKTQLNELTSCEEGLLLSTEVV